VRGVLVRRGRGNSLPDRLNESGPGPELNPVLAPNCCELLQGLVDLLVGAVLELVAAFFEAVDLLARDALRVAHRVFHVGRGDLGVGLGTAPGRAVDHRSRCGRGCRGAAAGLDVGADAARLHIGIDAAGRVAGRRGAELAGLTQLVAAKRGAGADAAADAADAGRRAVRAERADHAAAQADLRKGAGGEAAN